MENQYNPNPQDPQPEFNPGSSQPEPQPEAQGNPSQQGQPSGPPPFSQPQGQPSGPPPFTQPGATGGQYDYQQSYQQQNYQQQGYQKPNQQMGPLTNDDKLWAMLAHVLSLCFFWFPPLSFISPLVVWLLRRDFSTYVDRHAREALNFQFSCLIYSIASSFISFVLIIIVIGWILLPLALFALYVYWIVMTIIASIQAHEGNDYKYPLCIKFL